MYGPLTAIGMYNSVSSERISTDVAYQILEVNLCSIWQHVFHSFCFLLWLLLVAAIARSDPEKQEASAAIYLEVRVEQQLPQCIIRTPCTALHDSLSGMSSEPTHTTPTEPTKH